MKTNFHVKRGDLVQVITGNHKGSQGKVLQLLPAKQRVVIEGINMIKKHVKRSQDHPQGAIVEREGTVHVSNVKLIERLEKAEKQ